MAPKRAKEAKGVPNKKRDVPILDIENQGYDVWKKQIDIWCDVTEIVPEQQAMIIHLSLTGKAMQAAQNIQKDTLKTKDGMHNLLEIMDKIFIPEALQSDYAVDHKPCRVVRTSARTDCDYVKDFANQYLKFLHVNRDIPENGG